MIVNNKVYLMHLCSIVYNIHIELQEPAETEREKKEKRKTTLKAIEKI